MHAQELLAAFGKMSLENEHGVAIAVKAVFLFNRFSIKFLEPLDAFFAARCEKCGDEAE